MSNEPYEIRYSAEAVADLRAMRSLDRRKVWIGRVVNVLRVLVKRTDQTPEEMP